jgi:ketosteroid isomerase-like protein
VETPPPAPTATEAPAPPPKPALADLEMTAIKAYPGILTDATKIAALYAPDATMMIAGKTEISGRDAIQKAAASFNEGVSNPQMAVTRAWVKGNTVAFSWQLTATDKSTNKPFGLEGGTVLWFNDDGLITKDHTYADQVTMMKQVGAYKGQTPARPPATLSTAAMEVHTSKGDATEDTNIAASKAVEASWIAGDLKAMTDKMSDDYVMEDYSDQAATKKADFGNVLKAVVKSTADRKINDTTLFGAEDFTVDETEGAFTQKADFVLGKVKIPNKKKTVTFHGLEVDQWKDGKLVKSWSWSSGLEMANQLGIGPAAETKKPEAAKKEPAKADTAKAPKADTAKAPAPKK